MQTITFRNEEKIETSKVIELFRQKLEDSTNFEKSEIEELADIYAKNPVDKFIISDGKMLSNTFGRQGDILFWREGSAMYQREIGNVRNLKKTDRLVLQKNDSLTGDHRLIPIKGSNYTLKSGTFTPMFLQNKNTFGRANYDCLVLEIDKPFLVFHREHGNMAYPAGKYMIVSQLDPSTLNIMID